jgi:hypothetical protein
MCAACNEEKDMSKKISGAEYPLAKIFSSDFEYMIPSYQRPYAWTVDQASELFDDLYEFYKSEPDEGYFLGSIVLIKQEGIPHAEVIDGQQRLTTLTILLAALASRMTGSQKDTLANYIKEPGNEFENLEPKPRLTLRERDRRFFEQYVQALDFSGLNDLDPYSLANESQQNIQINSAYFTEILTKKFGRDLAALNGFVKFLLQRCFLVTVSTPSQQSAFRVFSVMNSRGLDLQPTDIIKADIIGKIVGEADKSDYNDRWEDMEVLLGRAGFNDLFTYVRMLYAKDKAKRALLEEFRTHVLSSVPSPKILIEQVLEPYAIALETIKKSNYEASANAGDVNTYLRWLNRIDNSDWIPPAIYFLSHQKHNPDYVLWFFKKLERLAAFMHICSKNINQRIDRYTELIEGLEKPHGPAHPALEVELTEDEKLSMRQQLNGNVYELTARRRNYIMLRLDAFMSDGAASYDHSILTIEHVLPQTVDLGSDWATNWPDADERSAWVHRIANLVPLNQRRNSTARNFDFDRKKTAYFSGPKQVSSYVLTTQVLNEANWTPDILEERQEALMAVLVENWELGASEQ